MADSTTGRLRGRRILITGAASGIGRAVAELFHAEGAGLALMDRDKPPLDIVAASLGAAAIEIDLMATQTIPAAVDAAADAMGGIDGIVNCAGYAKLAALEEIDLPLWEHVMAINLTAPYAICRAALPHLRVADAATIVNIASGQGLVPSAANNSAYSASKGGLITLGKALASELAPKIRVNAVCPGIVNTPMGAPLFQAFANPSDAPFVKQYAMKRIAEPVEIAQAVLFLTSTESSYITGTAMAVDGGRTFH